jgi:uncharacterized protein YodC (DUF2158 family)
MSIEVGTIVKSKLGGPEMMAYVVYNDGNVHCYWFDLLNNVHKDWFTICTLREVELEKE